MDHEEHLQTYVGKCQSYQIYGWNAFVLVESLQGELHAVHHINLCCYTSATKDVSAIRDVREARQQ